VRKVYTDLSNRYVERYEGDIDFFWDSIFPEDMDDIKGNPAEPKWEYYDNVL